MELPIPTTVTWLSPLQVSAMAAELRGEEAAAVELRDKSRARLERSVAAYREAAEVEVAEADARTAEAEARAAEVEALWEERGAALEAAGEEAARRQAEHDAARAEHATQLSSLQGEVRQQAEAKGRAEAACAAAEERVARLVDERARRLEAAEQARREQRRREEEEQALPRNRRQSVSRAPCA